MARHTFKPISQIRDALAQLPEQPREAQATSLFDAVTLLADDIRALLKKGYTYPEIADVLAEHGVRIAGRTLRNYMSRVGGSGIRNLQYGKGATPGELAPSGKLSKPYSASFIPASDDDGRQSAVSSAKFSPTPDQDEI